jgi:hypothetical protein
MGNDADALSDFFTITSKIVTFMENVYFGMKCAFPVSLRRTLETLFPPINARI